MILPSLRMSCVEESGLRSFLMALASASKIHQIISGELVLLFIIINKYDMKYKDSIMMAENNKTTQRCCAYHTATAAFGVMDLYYLNASILSGRCGTS